MRTSTAFLTLLALVAVAALAAFLWSEKPTNVDVERQESADVVGSDSPAEKRDPAASPESIETLPENDESLSQAPAESIQSLVGVSIEWKKGPVESDVAGMQKFHTAMAEFNAPELVRLAKVEHVTHAARVVAFIQTQCGGAPVTHEELEREMEALRQSGIVDSTLIEGDLLAADNEIRMHLQMMQEAFDKCTTLRSVLDGDDTDFMKLAADHGNPIAMIEHGRSILHDETELAKSYFDKSWDAGESSALFTLSNYEIDRFERGEDPSADVESVALFAAYAAVEEAKIELYSMDPSHPVALAITETADDARDRLDSLVPYKREMALARARELINSNSHCCIRVAW